MTARANRILKNVLACVVVLTSAVALAAQAGARTRNPQTPAARARAASTYAEARAILRFNSVGGNLSQVERRTSEFVSVAAP